MIRRLAPSLLLLAFSSVVGLLLLEGGARCYAWLTAQPRGMRFDADLGWRPVPHLAKRGEFWGTERPAHTNSRGWRDSEHDFERPPARSRIVVIGDSFTFGARVDDGARYSDHLSNLLPGVEVINLGVSSYGTDQELRVLEIEGLRYDPSIVILQVFVENDLDDISHERRYSWPKPYFAREGDTLTLFPPVQTWDVQLRQSSYVAELALQRLMPSAEDNRLAPPWRNADVVPLFTALLHRFRERVHAHAAHLLLVLAYAPRRLTKPMPDREQRARAAAGKNGAPVLDTFQMFAEALGRGESVYAEDRMHWNAAGHRNVAVAIADVIRQRGWPPAAGGAPGG